MINCTYNETQYVGHSLISGNQYITETKHKMLSENIIRLRITEIYKNYYDRGNADFYSHILYNPYKQGILNSFNMSNNYGENTKFYTIPQDLATSIYNNFMKKYPKDPFEFLNS